MQNSCDIKDSDTTYNQNSLTGKNTDLSESSHELWYTLGPSSLGREKEMFLNGATGVRFTFSYGNPELQKERALSIKKTISRLNCPCLLVADLAGEKFRIGLFDGEPKIQISKNAEIRFVHAKRTNPFRNFVFPVPSISFFKQVKEGNIITVGDGSAALGVTHVFEDEICAEMMNDGVIDQCRGLIIQDLDFNPKSLTPKDLKDLDEILSSNIFDIVALSFVSSADDILKARELAKAKNTPISVLAKIETSAGLQNIESICKEADYIMAARGDLALAIPWVELHSAVEKIATYAQRHNTQWFLATQIVEGLERFVMPTRPEICDLMHWLSKKCNGVMLSYETAFGSRPIQAIECVSLMIKHFNRQTSEH